MATLMCAYSFRLMVPFSHPFAGTGTTLVASQRLGMRGVGFEIPPEYCAIAEARIAEEHE
jgi:DNA modification methylase